MRMRESSYSVSLAGCLVLLMFLNVSGSRHRFLDRTIKGRTTLTSEWLEITPKPPLKPERDVQGIVLYLQTPYKERLDDALKGVRLSDGSLVIPEVQLIDLDGNVYDLKHNGAFGEKLMLYSIPDELKSKQFRSVRIRSEKTIRCKEIFWRCYFVTDID